MSYKKVFKINWDCNEDKIYYDFDNDIRHFFKKIRNQIKNNHKQIFLNFHYKEDIIKYKDIKYKKEFIKNEDLDYDLNILINRYYGFLKGDKSRKLFIVKKRFINYSLNNYFMFHNYFELGGLPISFIPINLPISFNPINLFITIKVCKENNYNTKLLYGIIKKIREYVFEPSNFKLNIIKDLLSRVTLFSYEKYFYYDFCEILTRSHCDLKLFEATKFFIFRLYQAGFYYEEDEKLGRLFIFNKKGQYNWGRVEADKFPRLIPSIRYIDNEEEEVAE